MDTLLQPGNIDVVLLLYQQGVCIRCIYRIFRIETIDFYRDRARSIEVLGTVSEKCKIEPSLLHGYDFTMMKIKSDDSLCRLCIGLLQDCDTQPAIKAIVEKIRQEMFNFQKFKFLVRVPNSSLLRFKQMVQFVKQFLKKNNLTVTNKQYFDEWRNNHMDIKLILKWILAPLVSKELQSCSTLEDDCLQISLVYENQQDEITTFNKFHDILKGMAMDRLDKKVDKVQKKIKQDKLDVLQKKAAYIEPSAANLQRILNLDSQFAFKTLLGSQFCPKVQQACKFKIQTRCNSIYLFGYYVKYSRYLSQTPWIINGVRLAQSSIQQELEKVLLKYFYPKEIHSSNLVKFHSGGREDTDVRMLIDGRPFALQLCSPRFNKLNMHIDKLTEEINESPYIGVNRLEITDSSCMEILKKSEQQKVKAYACFVNFQKPYTSQDVEKLNKITQLTLNQKTPLRVLHRRTLMVRLKTIHKLVALPVDSCNMILCVLASAGTYIKEFVHGDLGRTLPNIGSLTNNQADIFQLDVLKIYQRIDEQIIEDFIKISQLF